MAEPSPPRPTAAPDADDALGAAVRAWYAAAPPPSPHARAALLAAVAARAPRARRRWPAWAGTGLCAAAAAGFVLLRDPTRPHRDARVALAATRRAPAAPAATRDAGPAVAFRVTVPGAAHVALVGDFNGWDPRATQMRRGRDGAWRAELPLPPGRHVYAFVVDGRRWLADPAAPLAPEDAYGTRNSVVLVASTRRARHLTPPRSS